MKSESVKTTNLRVLALVVLIWSILFLLHYGFEFLLCGFVRDHSAIEIDGNNRSVVDSLVHGSMKNDEEMPDIENAVKIEHLSLMHKDEITITYNDETTFRFFIKNRYRHPLILYIKENGYIVYFRSAEFFWLVVKAGIFFSLCIASAVFLIKTKPPKKVERIPKRYRFKRVNK